MTASLTSAGCRAAVRHLRERRWWKMKLARTYGVMLGGVQGHLVEIEADIENGLVALLLAGLQDTALREARDRIGSAIVNNQHSWPHRRITVGLSPASGESAGARLLTGSGWGRALPARPRPPAATALLDPRKRRASRAS